ncbi:MAG: hybrid sensor histidine kinase/response regulator [Planctomycetota bacterium]
MIDAVSANMREGDASIVLDAITDVYALDDVQEVVDRVCACAVAVTPYRMALLSLYFGDDVYIGLVGGNEDLRQRFVSSATRMSNEQRVAKRARIWARHRIPGTAMCFIPEGSDVAFSPQYVPSPVREGSEWRPNDRVMVYVRGVDGEVHGVLSLDDPVDGRRPNLDDLGDHMAVDRLMKLMGVVIHNKHLESKLRESEARYAAVVEQSHDGVLIESDGMIRFANRRMGRMLDTMPGLLIGKALDTVVRSVDGPRLPGEEECVLTGRDGRTLDVSVRRTSIQFGGETANLITVADITEKKRVMAQLARSQKMESVGTLASGIAHDFNNLLGGILGYASLLRMRIGEEHGLVRYVESIESAADRASAVTRQLLGIVRDEQVRIGTFHIGRVLDDLSRFLRETLPPSIRIGMEYDDDLPMVLGDEGQIHQVLLNASLNARDAMPGGGSLMLRARRERRETGGDFVRLLVSDTGTGIDEATLPNVFDPFFTTKEAGQGTGLGLYMAYRVVERHSGRIDVRSRLGEGTTVEIVLPSSAEQRAYTSGPRLPDPAEVEGTILLVDDEELIRQMGEDMLTRLGFEVLLAEDGREALDICAEQGNRLCAVLLDIAMPGMNGWEVARSLRATRPLLPIVVSSGHDDGQAMNGTHGISDAYFLKKPYRVKELNAVLAEVLALSRAADRARETAR